MQRMHQQIAQHKKLRREAFTAATARPMSALDPNFKLEVDGNHAGARVRNRVPGRVRMPPGSR